MTDELKSGQGVVRSWEDKPTGWTDFKILFSGRSNPTKISTDDVALVNQVKGLGAGVVTNFTFAEVEGSINPRTNQPYMNRYLREVGGAGVAAAAADAGSTAPQGAGPSSGPREYSPEEIVRFDEKERREFRSRAWAQSIAALSHTIKTEWTADQVFDHVKRLQKKIYEDITQSFAYAADADIGYPGSEQGSHPDDDIPF